MTTRAHPAKRPLIRSARLWVPVGIVVVLVLMAVVGTLLANRAFAAKDALESGTPIIETETNIHQLGATFGVRVGSRRVSLLAELTVLYMIFETEILGQKTDLGGLVFAPGVGVAVDI